MTPQMQTIFGDDGNCFSACIASVLDIPIQQVPNFCEGEAGHNGMWFITLNNDFLLPRGLKARIRQSAPEGYAIAFGDGGRGWRHAVVVENGKMIHDPHPDRTGLVSISEYLVVTPIE